MKKEITVDKAINKGQLKLIFLPLLIFFIFIGLGLFFEKNQFIGAWIMLISLFLGFIFRWLTWSFFVNRWKIWAFENVQNVHELKQKAIEQKLIWRDGSWFEKTEFKSQKQKTKLKELEKKFLKKDVYKDDINVPKETKIFYSKFTLITNISIYFFSFSFIAFYIFENIIIRIVLVVIAVFLNYSLIKKLINREPQIIINDLGIKFESKKLIPWNKIQNEHVITNFLVFNDTSIETEYLNIKTSKLEKLLRVYRVRFENNSTSR
ncbi:hypothetical protein [Flavobacterium sp.]|uniref:hypothetical protein n=1 Tax=Flavobacterium sp. TaxID=239 RepID=UPI0031D965FF